MIAETYIDTGIMVKSYVLEASSSHFACRGLTPGEGTRPTASKNAAVVGRVPRPGALSALKTRTAGSRPILQRLWKPVAPRWPLSMTCNASSPP